VTFEVTVAPEATFLLASGLSGILRSSEANEDAPEVAVDQPRRTFNGKMGGEAPSTRAKRLRIESGEQQLPSHLVAEVRFGRGRFVTCICGHRVGGRSDGAMAWAFSVHARGSFDRSIQADDDLSTSETVSEC
jgi:hypothetical protein